MNSQFQKLAEQAGMYVDVNGKPWPKWMGADECEVAYQKFAELIVQECIECADIVGKSNLASGYPNSTAHHVKQKIREHFGVEE